MEQTREQRINCVLTLVEAAIVECADDEVGEYRLCTVLGGLLANRAVKLGGETGLDFLLRNIYAAGNAQLSSSSP